MRTAAGRSTRSTCRDVADCHSRFLRILGTLSRSLSIIRWATSSQPTLARSSWRLAMAARPARTCCPCAGPGAPRRRGADGEQTVGVSCSVLGVDAVPECGTGSKGWLLLDGATALVVALRHQDRAVVDVNSGADEWGRRRPTRHQHLVHVWCKPSNAGTGPGRHCTKHPRLSQVRHALLLW